MENEKSPILEIKDLRVTYETDIEVVEAVNGISFQIEKGKTLGLVGETGAGKTTTALSILRLLPETTGRIKGGEIRFEGEDLLHVDDEQMRVVRGNRISMVFQDPMSSLNPVYTVGDQIGEAIRLHRPELSNDAVEQRIEDPPVGRHYAIAKARVSTSVFRRYEAARCYRYGVVLRARAAHCG